MHHLYRLASLADALRVREIDVRSVLRGPGGSYLGTRHRMPRSLTELLTVAALVALKGVLRRSQRAAVLALSTRADFQLWASDPWHGVQLVVPAGGLDPYLVDLKTTRPDDPRIARMWAGIRLDLYDMLVGLRDELERLASENPSWAARHVATIAVGWSDDKPKAGAKPSRIAFPDVLTLRDVIEG